MPLKYFLVFLSLLCLGDAYNGNAQFVPPARPSLPPDSLDHTVRHLSMKPEVVRYNYYRELGAACKVEWQLERATRIPFRIRLGSLQQTDYLEQKPQAQRPQ